MRWRFLSGGCWCWHGDDGLEIILHELEAITGEGGHNFFSCDGEKLSDGRKCFKGSTKRGRAAKDFFWQGVGNENKSVEQGGGRGGGGTSTASLASSIAFSYSPILKSRLAMDKCMLAFSFIATVMFMATVTIWWW